MGLRRTMAAVAFAVVGAACSHTESYEPPAATAVGPMTSSAIVQLTFNTDQNYWPTWSADGKGILYSFVDAESAVLSPHRCLGIIPAAGGTRLWQMCDNRAVRNDTVSSYSGYALSADGKLLVAEATAPRNSPVEPIPRVLLWLADTAKPYARATLLTLPAAVDGFTATWLVELQWIGSNQFIGLAQQLVTLPHCAFCACFPCPRDSVFSDAGMVVVGTIAGTTAVLHVVRGTDSATSYSLAENGASIVFTRHHDLRLFKVPIGGGVSIPVPVSRTGADTAELMVGELTGVSCRATTCLVASSGIFLSDTYFGGVGKTVFKFAGFLPISGGVSPPLPNSLQSTSLVDGSSTVLQDGDVTSTYVRSSPKISPATGDVVYQLGGVWGHLQTFATSGKGNGQLILLKGVVQ